MKTKNKIMLGIGSFFTVILVALAVIWFSIPEGQRNMILFMAGTGNEKYEDYVEYQVIDRNPNPLEASFEVVPGVTSNVNIQTIAGPLKNEDSSMLKIGRVETIGIESDNGWQILADEVVSGDNGYPYATSPLSYYTTGLASNLHTQVLDAATILNVDITSVTVEVMNTFRWNEMSTADGAGFLDVSYTNILIDSESSIEEIEAVVDLALKGWASGNALLNETIVEPHLIINGNQFETYPTIVGTSNSVDSFVGDLQLSKVTEEPVLPSTIELTSNEESSILDMLTNMDNLQFEIYSISESVYNEDRPYLNKVTTVSPTGETWELYADEYMFEGDVTVAPTSLEYFTLGTSLCLTSQTTLVIAMMDLDYDDVRVEHTFEYSLENMYTESMEGNIAKIHTYIIIESDEDNQTIEEFFNKSLSLCFAGEGLVNETEMIVQTYLNGSLIE